MKLFPCRLGFLLVGCCLLLVWISWFTTEQGPAEPSDLQILYDRLDQAQEMGVKVHQGLSSVLDQLKTSRVTNSSRSAEPEPEPEPAGTSSQQLFLQPNIYLYMPHLRTHPDGLVPNVVLGGGRRGVSVVLGVPTVRREQQNYLQNTLSSLLFSLTSSQRCDLLIVVLVAETDSEYVNNVADIIRKNFPQEVRSGLMEVVSPSPFYYPDFSRLTETLGDSKDRVRWRTKQNLDFSFLMLYAQNRGTYYVQLEDDVIAKAGYYGDMKTFASRKESLPWLYLEFSQLGFIGKMFRTRDLLMIAEFFLMFHRDKPIDWLLDHILWVKVCNPEKNQKACDEQKSLLKLRFKPSLFQHVGLHSSLPGKVQNLKDKDFGNPVLFQAHQNPPADVSSSMTQYQQHSLDRLYRGQDFFWALTPVQGDHVLLRFPRPVHVTGFLFRSGNTESSRDLFFNTTVEVLPSSASVRHKLVQDSSSHFKESENGFIIVGEFENGVAEGEVEESLQPVSAVRLVVQSDSEAWAVLSEVFIKV